jgi:superfamily I DNA and/or RNA helicase/very-short-patch-repair endonuclease
MKFEEFILKQIREKACNLDELYFLAEKEFQESLIVTKNSIYEVLEDYQTKELIHLSKGKWKEGRDPNVKPQKTDEKHEVLSYEAKQRWADFRRLLGYYIECVRFDEKAAYKLFYEKANQQWISIAMYRDWCKLAEGELLNIPLSEVHSPFVLNAVTQKDEQLFLGYPIQKVKTPKHKFSVPIFCIPISTKKLKGTTLQISLDYESTDINSEWLEYACPNREARDHFLNVAGLRDPGSIEYEDEVSENEIVEGNVEVRPFDINRLIDAVTLFQGDKLCGRRLDPKNITPLSPISQLEEGIHNGIVLFTGNKLRYASSLIKELRRLQNHAKDDEFEQSALKHLFFPSENQSNDILEEHNKDVGVFPVLNLTQSQFSAVSRCVSENLSLVTGPPGTGKSQVVSVALASTLLNGQTGVFASRNTSALDAVVPRLNSITDGLPLIRRHKDNDIGNLSWEKLIDEIIANPRLDDCIYSELESKKNLCRNKSLKLLEKIETYNQFLLRQKRTTDQLWKKEEILSKKEYDALDWGPILLGNAQEVLKEYLGFLKKHKNQLISSEPPLWMFWKSFPIRKVRRKLFFLNEKISSLPGFSASFLSLNKSDFSSIISKLELFLKDLQYLKNCRLENDEESDSFEPLTHRKECNLLIEELNELAISTLNLVLKTGLHSFSNDERRQLSSAKVLLKQLDDANSEITIRELSRQLEFTFETLISKVPLLAVTNLSTMSLFPSTSHSQFDLLVVDEASQCDIASTIPLLYRAKRVCVIGDPKQLKAIHSMKESMNAYLKTKSRLNDIRFAPYDYLTFSFFDLASYWCGDSQRTILREHFRCHSRIANYCNNIAYNNDLYVLTDENRLSGDYNGRRGLYWENVEGDCVRAPGGGSKCREEAEAVVKVVSEMSKRNDKRFSLGVVSPFKSQAKLIKEMLEKVLEPDTWNEMNLRVATADGFQGDERDVIIFSITCQPSMKRGSLWFVGQEKNRWNVAVSRAKSLLYVVGNKSFCKNSDIPHLKRLAEHAEIENTFEGKKFDSPWEEKLFLALKDANIDTVPQHPLVGYRLDLAIPRLKLDIEVDGVQYHLDEFGKRKSSDLWRDMTVENLGWTVLRFWVHELKNDMDGCVAKIRSYSEKNKF